MIVVVVRYDDERSNNNDDNNDDNNDSNNDSNNDNDSNDSNTRVDGKTSHLGFDVCAF